MREQGAGAGGFVKLNKTTRIAASRVVTDNIIVFLVVHASALSPAIIVVCAHIVRGVRTQQNRAQFDSCGKNIKMFLRYP